MIYRLSLARLQPQKRSRRQNAAQLLFLKLFIFRERSRNAGFSCYNVTPLPRTVAPPPCLPLDIKDSLKEDWGFFDGRFFDGEF
jgi:hypothetical protein